MLCSKVMFKHTLHHMYAITLSSKLLITSSARCYRKHVFKCNTPYEYDTCHLMLFEKKGQRETGQGEKHRNNGKTKSNQNDETKTNRIIYIIHFSSIRSYNLHFIIIKKNLRSSKIKNEE